MRRAWFLASWGFVGASVALACGGSSDSGLFGSSTDATSSSSSSGETTSSSNGGTTTSSSGTTTSSSGTTTSSGGTTTSSGGSSGGSSGIVDAGVDAGKVCNRTTAGACADTEYCKVVGCGVSGNCTKKPAQVVQGDVVCGCDGISYWNAELAASFGVSANPNFAGACQGGVVKTCSSVNDCPSGRFCNYQTTATANGLCAITTSGDCWGLPNSCPPLSGGRAKECNTETCKTFCEAVKAEKPWFEEVANKCN